MKLAFPSPEFDDAVAAVCHGSTTEVEMRALNELLRHDSRARDEYLLRVELHARLASEPDLFADFADVAASRQCAAIFPQESMWRSAKTPLRNQDSGWRTPMVWSLALAACLVLIVWSVWSFWFQRPAPRTGTTSKAVAMLTRVVGARWASSAGPLRAGGALEPGWLRLESGLAEVAFYSGARVVMEGPTELRLVSPSEAVCPVGRLLAEVPPPARGFRVKTDHLEVVDVGTAFGLVAARGRTEVHVFNGEVRLHSAGAAEQSLSEGQAVAVAGGVGPRLMAARAAAFTSLFEFRQRSLASEAFRYEHWQFASAQLNEDPSLVLRLDFDSRGGTDWTLRNTAEGSRSVPEATIVGCQRVEGRWREKPALEFQSVNDRVRLAVPGEFEALTLAAWVRLSGLDREFNSLFMCDGFQPRTIHWLIRRDGVLGLTVFGADPGQFQILASPPVLTPDQFGTWLHLAVVLNGPAREVVHYVNGEPVSGETLELHSPFRLGPTELGNWNAGGSLKPGPHLIRNLSGALDEFVLFRRALTDAEIRALHAAGKPQPDP